MTRRPAVTLMEVLIAMFIMAIGMLALLALFPVGAVSMAQALKDDRCANAASVAENVAIIQDIRHDATVSSSLLASQVVYVDPYGALIGGLGALGGVIPRVTPSFITNDLVHPTFDVDRWFSLPDGITFTDDAIPDTTSGFVDRDRRYTYAYMLRQLPTSAFVLAPSNLVQLYVVVYNGRPTNVLSIESSLGATGTAGSNSIVVNSAATTIKRGGWILDTSSAAAGFFYRVTNLTESGSTTTVELQSNLIANVSQVTIMDDVAEVFDKGTSWQP
jgi:hypothetical protein